MKRKAPNFKDLTGQKFNKLTVINQLESIKNTAFWLCRCDCGNEIKVSASHLKNNHTKSCGCLKKEGNNKTHGLSGTNIYQCWRSMLTRCYDENHRDYKYWGGRGITVFDRWKNSFENFLEDMGKSYKKGLTLERKDVNKAYSLENCEWIPKSKQSQNLRSNKLTMEKAEYIRNSGKSVKELEKEFNVSKSTIYYIRKNQLWKSI